MKKFLLFMKTNNLVKLMIVCLLFVSGTIFSQNPVKNHYAAKGVVLFDKNSYDLSGFELREKKKIGLDVLALIDEQYLDHPDLGLSVHPYHKDAIELVDERDHFRSVYLMPDGTTIFSSSNSPINYIDENGWFREIRYELDEKPFIENVYRASQQAIPKSIDISSGKTSFESAIGTISINQETKLRYFNGIDEIGRIEQTNFSKTQVGKNGVFVENAFNGIDMQIILLKSGEVKTNYIIKDRSVVNSNAEFMVFEDVVRLPEGMHFDFDTDKGINNGNENDWEGSLVIRDKDNKDVFHYMSPFTYDDKYTEAMMNVPASTYSIATESVEHPGVNSDAYTYGAYRVEKVNATTFKVSIVVKTEWLLAEERVYPVVVDPVTFTGVALNLGANIATGGNCANDGGAAPAGEGGGRACARRVSGTTPVDNPGPNGVGCYCSTTVLPAGYMLVASMPVRVISGYATRGCAASSTWQKFYGPCGMYPRETGFFYFCNTTFANVDCTSPGGGHSMDGILSRCMLSAGEDCAAATPPSCSDQTITFSICTQSRCFAQAAGTCVQRSNVNATNYVEGLGNFRVDVLGEKITATLTGNPASGSNVCPDQVIPLTLGTRFGVPSGGGAATGGPFNTSNCTDQMGGAYTYTASATAGTLSTTAGVTNNPTGGITGFTWTAPSSPFVGAVTISVTVCNTACPAPAGTMCDTRTLTYNVGPAIPPVVADVSSCNNINATASISNVQAGYTYTWYTNAAGTTGAATGSSRSYPFVNNSTQTYSVRATSPCASTLTTFTITWGPLADPITTNDTKCPGQLANLTANCGANCRWYAVPAGGAALTTAGSLTVSGGSLSVNPVASAVTYYVENYVSAGCISTRVPVTISTNALTVTTNPTSFNPLCSPSTAQFTSSVTGNTDVGPSEVCNTNTNTVENTGGCSGPDCTAANSGLLTVTTPAGVTTPLANTSIQEVCFSITGANGSWCGEDTRFYLTSPAGTTFTLYGGRAKNSTNNQGAVDLCFSGSASAVIFAPTTGASVNITSGTYIADGGDITTAFVGQAAATGSTWTLSIADVATGGGTCGAGAFSVSNFCMTFGVSQLPAYSWSGTPGSLSNAAISNPVYTPPGTNYNGTYTVTVTDAVGCTGTATVGVACALLPIELLSFYGEVGDRDNYLFWNTASEKNTDYFDVERSGNGKDFIKIGKVEAAENSFSLKEYTLTDKQRLEGLNYYRLKMVDMDGMFEYSGIVVLENTNSEITMDIIPNPANSYVDIAFNLNFASQSTIKIFDVKGSLIETIDMNATKGLNSHKVNLENYAKGVYSVVLNNNGTISTKRFIKQ